MPTQLAANLGVDQSARSRSSRRTRPSSRCWRRRSSGRAEDLTEENLQSRIRGVLLMALSNKFGWLVLTTGNKSETAVGYSTLYGDTAGGLAVIKDLPKLAVYELCRWRNEPRTVPWIPESILTKAPSAELRPDQRDDQSLPPYEVLDPLIEDYVDRRHDRGATGRRRPRPRPGPTCGTLWSTWRSTSAASHRPACGSRRRRSVGTVVCRSRTRIGGPPERRGCAALTGQAGTERELGRGAFASASCPRTCVR